MPSLRSRNGSVLPLRPPTAVPVETGVWRLSRASLPLFRSELAQWAVRPRRPSNSKDPCCFLSTYRRVFKTFKLSIPGTIQFEVRDPSATFRKSPSSPLQTAFEVLRRQRNSSLERALMNVFISLAGPRTWRVTRLAIVRSATRSNRSLFIPIVTTPCVCVWVQAYVGGWVIGRQDHFKPTNRVIDRIDSSCLAPLESDPHSWWGRALGISSYCLELLGGHNEAENWCSGFSIDDQPFRRLMFGIPSALCAYPMCTATRPDSWRRRPLCMDPSLLASLVVTGHCIKGRDGFSDTLSFTCSFPSPVLFFSFPGLRGTLPTSLTFIYFHFHFNTVLQAFFLSLTGPSVEHAVYFSDSVRRFPGRLCSGQRPTHGHPTWVP